MMAAGCVFGCMWMSEPLQLDNIGVPEQVPSFVAASLASLLEHIE